MNFETMSLLLNWMELGALLAILFRLGHTFNLIANTQRQLRRAVYYLGERRCAELASKALAGAGDSTRFPVRRSAGFRGRDG